MDQNELTNDRKDSRRREDAFCGSPADVPLLEFVRGGVVLKCTARELEALMAAAANPETTSV